MYTQLVKIAIRRADPTNDCGQRQEHIHHAEEFATGVEGWLLALFMAFASTHMKDEGRMQTVEGCSE